MAWHGSSFCAQTALSFLGNDPFGGVGHELIPWFEYYERELPVTKLTLAHVELSTCMPLLVVAQDTLEHLELCKVGVAADFPFEELSFARLKTLKLTQAKGSTFVEGSEDDEGLPLLRFDYGELLKPELCAWLGSLDTLQDLDLAFEVTWFFTGSMWQQLVGVLPPSLSSLTITVGFSCFADLLAEALERGELPKLKAVTFRTSQLTYKHSSQEREETYARFFDAFKEIAASRQMDVQVLYDF